MSRWNFKIEMCLIFDYRVYFLQINENTGTFPHMNSFSLTSAYKCITFPQRLGAEACYPLHHRKPEVLSFFFFARKTLLFQHNKLAMAANVGDTNHETDKLELYPLFSNRNV